MIVPDQQNLKVHFAAIENIDQFVSAQAAGVQYQLFTAFPFICEKIGIKGISINANVPQMRIPSLIYETCRHAIMDSGLFTLMFGSHKGQKDRPLLERWLDNLVGLVYEGEYRGTCVEVDCQKVLNPDAAWEFRYAMRERLPNNRIINVFHIEDGQIGLDRLIEFSDYIALSIPELRFAGKKVHAVRLANYVKNRKPEIDIHLLGCTEQKLLRELSFCSSSDSSSWTDCVRYGKMKTMRGEFHIDQFKASAKAPEYAARVTTVLQRHGISLPNPLRTASLAYAAEQLKLLYAEWAGPQN